jgi:predicted nuclease of predicted toxin-antitoxin system
VVSLRIFFDNCASGDFLATLRAEFGQQVATAAWEIGRADLPDEEQLAFATANNLVLYTHDYDFVSIYESWYLAEQHHAGIVICHDRRKVDVGFQLSRFRTILRNETAASVRDILILLEAVQPSPS